MKILHKICFVLLMTTFPSVYGGSCWDKVSNVDDCLVRAERGNSSAQYNLGVLYDNGRGVRKDYKEAVKWYRKAAEQGLAGAQNNLGVLYDNGQGVRKDYKEAVKWYRKSAEQGYSKAQSNLGLMYANGQGVIQDYVMAHMYFNIASVSGDKDAIKGRYLVEEQMTRYQLEKAQDLAREWMRTHQ